MGNTLTLEQAFDRAMAIVEANRLETMEKIKEDRKIHEEKMEKQRLETMAKMEEDRKVMLAKIEADKKLHEERMAKIEEDRKAERKIDEKLHEEKMAKIAEESERRLNKTMGELTRRFGEVIEYMIAPDLCSKFEKYGFSFQQSNIRQQISDGKKILTEIDVLLEDGDFTMAVEIKTKPTMYDLNRHIKRMGQVKQYPPRSVRGTKLYGAIAGAVVEEEIKEAAFEAGFYVVTHSGENVTIVPPPETFVAKCWEVPANRS